MPDPIFARSIKSFACESCEAEKGECHCSSRDCRGYLVSEFLLLLRYSALQVRPKDFNLYCSMLQFKV